MKFVPTIIVSSFFILITLSTILSYNMRNRGLKRELEEGNKSKEAATSPNTATKKSSDELDIEIQVHSSKKRKAREEADKSKEAATTTESATVKSSKEKKTREEADKSKEATTPVTSKSSQEGEIKKDATAASKERKS